MSSIVTPHPEKRRSLILVDLQEGFLNDTSRWIVPNIKEVIEKGGYDLIVETIFSAEKGSLWDRQTHWTFPLVPTTHDIKQLLNERAVLVTKKTKSAFKGEKDLFKILKDNNIEEVHIVGIDTNDCVFATAQESFDLGFFTYVLEECTASSQNEAYREAALKILRELCMTNHSF
ncbi:MAG: hypothetical protein RLZZ347_212 [Candidatus Parcubacteria bacterium]|jgi:nicotinamidase-related amidase